MFATLATVAVAASLLGATAPAPTVQTAAAAKLDVRTLQARLTRQGFWLGTVDGQYGPTTRQAVLAAQKAAGLARDGIPGPATLTAIRKGIRTAVRTKTGHAIEVDKGRQLLIVADNGKATRILNTSTGSGQTYRTSTGRTARAVTPSGTYRIQRRINGWHTAPLGRLYAPGFFNGGIAIHGSTSIPAYPASHGCVRATATRADGTPPHPKASTGHPRTRPNSGSQRHSTPTSSHSRQSTRPRVSPESTSS